MIKNNQSIKISRKRLQEIILEEYEDSMSPCGCSDIPLGDQEGRMAKQQLSNIASYAQEISQILGDETQLEAWVQAKLTKAADYIKTVKHYVEYGAEEGVYDQPQPEMGEETAELLPPVPETDVEEVGFDYDPEEFDKYGG